MKRILLAISLLVGGVASAQQDLQEQINQLRAEINQLKATPPAPLPMPENEGEQLIHKKFNMYFNFQGSFDLEKAKDKDMTAKFYARQLRWEVRGDITDRIFYRFRHRLNKSNVAASLDNLATATDMLYAGFRLDDKWTLTAGKMCQAWGGFEFDLNRTTSLTSKLLMYAMINSKRFMEQLRILSEQVKLLLPTSLIGMVIYLIILYKLVGEVVCKVKPMAITTGY